MRQQHSVVCPSPSPPPPTDIHTQIYIHINIHTHVHPQCHAFCDWPFGSGLLVRSGRSCCLPMYATPNCRDFIQFVAAAAAAATNVATCQPASAAQNCFRLLRSTFHENIPALRSRFHSPVRNAHKKCCVQRPQAAQPSKPMPSHAPFRTNPPPRNPRRRRQPGVPMHNCCLYEKISPNGVLHYLPPDAALPTMTTTSLPLPTATK